MSTQESVETERKYDADLETPLPAFEDITGVEQVADPADHQLEAVYFDTKGVGRLGDHRRRAYRQRTEVARDSLVGRGAGRLRTGPRTEQRERDGLPASGNTGPSAGTHEHHNPVREPRDDRGRRTGRRTPRGINRVPADVVDRNCGIRGGGVAPCGLSVPLCAARGRCPGQTPLRAAASRPAARPTLQRGVLPERMVPRGRLSVAPQPFGQGLAQDLAGREAKGL